MNNYKNIYKKSIIFIEKLILKIYILNWTFFKKKKKKKKNKIKY